MKSKEPFSQYLIRLRERLGLANYKLAEMAGVPESLISELQNGRRGVGEVQARRIGAALKLKDDELEDFVLRAVNTSSARTLSSTAAYPSELINYLATQLRTMGILPEHLRHCEVNQNDIDIYLNSGKKAQIKTEIAYA